MIALWRVEATLITRMQFVIEPQVVCADGLQSYNLSILLVYEQVVVFGWLFAS